MAVFTRIGAPELAELAGGFGLGDVVTYTAVAAGTINTNLDLTTSRGRWFVRINEGKAEADVAWEARLVEALADQGVVTPAPLRAVDGRPYAALPGTSRKWVSVFPWRSGRHFAADEITPPIARLLGGALAKFHLVGLALPAAWRRGSIYDHDHLEGRYARFAGTCDPQLVRAVDVLGDELVVAAESLTVRRRATFGIIHGDLFRDNVLWATDGASNGEPELTAILDFEQASGGSLAYDLAVCINDWCWSQGPRIDLAAALLGGYNEVRQLPPSDRDALPIEVRAAAARFTITRITDVYLARVDNPDKDFRAFLARTEAWRGPALSQLTAVL